MLALLSIVLAAPVGPGAVFLGVPGLDECCAQRGVTALQAVPGVSSVSADVANQRYCVQLRSAVEADSFHATLKGAGFTMSEATPTSQCGAAATTDPWNDPGGLDVRTISRGEVVDLEAHAVTGKYTFYDFGAPWCAPCFETTAQLKTYMSSHADVAVRAVLLDAADARASFAMPVVQQHLQWAEGLPYFIVRSPTGKTIYKGSDLDAALSAIEKNRK